MLACLVLPGKPVSSGVPPDQEVMSMPGEHSPSAERLLRVLTDPSPDDDAFSGKRRDLSRLTDEELGVLIPAAYQVRSADGDAARLVSMVEEDIWHAVRERQPRFAPESCVGMFAALVAGLGTRQWADLTLGVGSLLRCTGPWPAGLAEPAGELVRFLLRHDRLDQPYALLAVAGLAGEPLRREVVEQLRQEQGPIAREELDVILTWDLPGQALMAEVVGYHSFRAPPRLPDAWERLAASDYAAFARRALEAADARLAAIHSGELAYLADGAFTRDETEVLGRAARVALVRDEPWLAELFGRLLAGVAVAPTAARTLPSQALLFELARAVEEFPTAEAVAALRTTRGVVRHKGVPKQLDRMFKRIEQALADRSKVALRLPHLGFGPDGARRRAVGGYVATITVADDVGLSWRRADGRTLRGVPATVRHDHSAEVRELRGLVKQVRSQLLTLARALEAGYSAETVWPYGRWRKELATHPLAGTMARRLIWEVEASPGRWQAVLPNDGGAELRDTAGTAVPAPDPDAAIRLWHPIRAQTQEVRAWRDLFTERRVRQPFKQAFREIYLLTPAELATRIYSNRFAAHIVRYRQFRALVSARGWGSDLLGPWSGGDDGQACGVFAAGSWRACLYHEWVEQADDTGYAATDQVRFERKLDGAWRLAPLEEVPAVVFSEAMRDVDLFVGVTSIAADPDWADRGEHRFRQYWRTASFGELSPMARVRRDAIQRIIPKTRIADRCTVGERYLVVRGGLRTYKIHLGSANILMEPDDSYLCIVPSPRSGRDEVFLPFEDDRLALIVSKAFLLADDTSITAETILSQIKRGS